MLLNVSDDIQKALNKNRVIALILIDFFKAFDKIDHEKLLRTLFYLKFGKILIAIISSYLANRKQYAQVNDQSPLLLSMIFGVLQESI